MDIFFMRVPGSHAVESFITMSALIRSRICMNVQMDLQIGFDGETFAANGAHVRFGAIFSVDINHVLPHALFCLEMFAALLAL